MFDITRLSYRERKIFSKNKEGLGMTCHTQLLKKSSETREGATTNPQSHPSYEMYIHVEWDGSEDGYWHFPLSWPYMDIIIMNMMSTAKPLCTV